MNQPSPRKFDSGRIVVTANVANWLTGNPERHHFTAQCLARHATGDWGDLDPEDATANDWALITSDRLLSAYPLPHDRPNDQDRPDNQDRIWIITEADRSATTILWPSDY